jgi:hypothetical protein
MRILRLCLFIALPAPALADDCAVRLSALLGTPPFEGQPYIAETATVSGGYAGRFTQNWASLRHSLMVTHEPPGMPDTLQYEGGTYAPDGNGGWTLLYQSDPAQMEADTRAMQAAMAAAVTKATCGPEDRDGKTLDRLKGTLTNIPPYEGDVAVSYLIDPATGQVAEMDMAYRMAGIDNTVTFVFSPAPGMVLPVP